MSDDEKKMQTAASGLQASLDQDGRAEVRDVDSVYRLFRTDFDDSVSRDFVEQKDRIYEIYQALQDCLSSGPRGGAADMPDAGRIVEQMRKARDRHRSQESLPDQESLEATLRLMQDQTPPFVYCFRELLPVPDGVSAVSRFVSATPGEPALPQRVFQASVSRTISALKVAAESNGLYGNWEQVLESVGSNGLEATNLNFGVRIDGVLRDLYVRATAPDEVTRARLARVNRELKHFIFAPLFHRLREGRLVFVLNCRDYRDGGEAFRSLPDLVYLNRPERLRERLLGLCRVVLSAPFAAYVDAGAAESARTHLEDAELLLEHCRPVIAALRERLATGDVPAHVAAIAVEVIKLEEYVRLHVRKAEVGQQLDELGRLVERIRKAGTLFNLTGDRKLKVNPKYVKLCLEEKLPSIMACPVPIVEYDSSMDVTQFRGVYTLERNRTATGRAVEMAVEFYRKSADALLLRILERMFQLDVRPDEELKHFVSPGHLEMLRETLYESYVEKLPFISRLMIRLFGRKVSPLQLRQARENTRRDEHAQVRQTASRTAAARKKDAQVAIKERARSNVTAAEGAAPQQRAEVVASVARFLAAEWKAGRYPFRADVLRGDRAGRSFAVEAVLDLADQNHADAEAIASIAVEGRGNLYASQGYLASSRAQIRSSCEAKINDNLRLIQAASDEAARAAANRNRQIYKAILGYLDRMQ